MAKKQSLKPIFVKSAFVKWKVNKLMLSSIPN